MYLQYLIVAWSFVSLGVAVTPSARGVGPAATGRANVPESGAALRQDRGPLREVPSGPHPSFSWPPTSRASRQNCKKIQFDFPAGTNGDPTRAEAVRDLYNRSWAQYTQYCFGKDDLDPLSNNCEQDLMGWGASIVDGIDTAIIMNLTDVVKAQLAFIAKVDFSTSAYGLVAGFDSVIRYLGGLLSAYDLLSNGYVPTGTYPQDDVDALLKQAVVLGEKLKYQFNTPSGLPAYQINFTSNEIVNSTFTDPLNNQTYYDINAAIAGTIIIEFHRLSDLTGDMTYRTLADKAESYLVNPNPAPVYPGLIGSELDVATGNFLTYDFGWKAGVDSFLEYLIKSYIYNPAAATAETYKNFWVTAVDSTIEHIALHPYNHSELTFISQADMNGNIEYAMDDYACFAGGNYLIGGVYLDQPDYVDLGLRVTESCHNTYNNTVSGLGPFFWAWYNATDQAYDPSDDNNTAYRAEAAKNGYFIVDPGYGAFPETLESIWYAWRITGDTKWQEYNWGIVEALAKEVNSQGDPVPQLNDVNDPSSQSDYIPSFFYAEVLKYLYLTFTDPDIVSLDDFVFNTECHPVRRIAQC